MDDFKLSNICQFLLVTNSMISVIVATQTNGAGDNRTTPYANDIPASGLLPSISHPINSKEKKKQKQATNENIRHKNALISLRADLLLVIKLVIVRRYSTTKYFN